MDTFGVRLQVGGHEMREYDLMHDLRVIVSIIVKL